MRMCERHYPLVYKAGCSRITLIRVLHSLVYTSSFSVFLVIRNNYNWCQLHNG